MVSSNKMHKIEVTAPLHTEAAALAEIADVLALPAEGKRQPDLQYLTAIFVSSGMNKNGAVFLGSEMVKARNTISSKAVDLEHDEQHVIGQITASAFLNRDRTVFDAESAALSLSVEQLDEREMDIGITAIIHKKRFPEIADEVLEGKWMVSMEAYYRDFDIKVGDLIIPREKAEEMGFDKLVGSVVQLRNGSQEMGFHLVGRVLRDIHFAGVGLVQNPANPRSIIMESAALDEYVQAEAQKSPQIINLADIEIIESVLADSSAAPTIDTERINEMIKDAIDAVLSIEPPKEEAAQPRNDVLPGLCVSYKRYVYEAAPPPPIEEPADDLTQVPLHNPAGDAGMPGPRDRVVKEHHCNLFDLECAARPGDATSPTCWRNVFARTMGDEIFSHEQLLRERRLRSGLVSLQALLDDAKKFNQ